MKIKKRYIALGTFCALMGALYYDLSTPPKTEVEGHFLVVMDEEPFLIPKDYHYGYATHDGPTNAVVLSAGLPDLTPNAAELAASAPIRRSDDGVKEWRIRSPHELSGYAELPYQVNVVPGRSAIERYILNGLSYGDRNPNLSDEERKPETVLKKWWAFVEKNNHRDGELINANDVLHTWSNKDDNYIVFSKGLVVLRAACNKPAKGTTPSCWTDYHEPNTKYVFSLIYDLRYLDQTYDIAKKSAALIKQWNVSAHAYLKAKKERTP